MLLGLVALCVAINAVFCGILRLRRIRRPRPQPPPAERLSPAAVQLLLHNGSVTTSAVAHTLLALERAARVHLTHLDHGRLAVTTAPATPAPEQRDARPPARPEDGPPGVAGIEPAPRHGELVLQRIEQRRGGLEWVPLAALGPADGKEYDRWWKEFRQAVRDESDEAGLVWGPAGDGELFAWKALALLLGVLLFCGWLPYVGSLYWSGMLALLTLPLIMVPVNLLTYGPKLTPEGRQAARWWRANGSPADDPALDPLVVCRSLAPGAAPGETPRSDRWVWSSHGGRWRPVRIGSVSRWGLPSQFVVLTLLCAAVALSLGSGFRRLPASEAAVPVSVPVLCWVVVTALWLPAFRRLRRFPAEESFEATVVSLWSRVITSGRDNSRSRTAYYCALDDGRSSYAWSFGLDPRLWARLRTGDLVRAECRSHRIRLTSLTVLQQTGQPPVPLDKRPRET
ncbi:hypothetical protein ACIHFE_27460 [Streptomyces sp. NPDC052396]|uniref:hypothetical protein n=1 Tax=Streptomyces sp. NPDC052396 TaxID=3365689 RepID=UPI0037CF0BE9